jgi:hypothetical protein
MTTKYWIAQHVADVFRNEPRNVGVVVVAADGTHARFFGEDENLGLDGRRLKSLPYPEVYRQWVAYWRKGLADVNALANATSGHYRLTVGGEVSDTAAATPADVSEYLYSALVSEGAIGEALQERAAADAPWVQLETEVEKSLRDSGLLAVGDADLFIAHPIERRQVVQGKKLEHRPAFSQRNGHLCVIETVDLSTPRKTPNRDHAGFVAYMFRDIHDADSDLEALSVVRVTDEDRRNLDVAYALDALNSESTVVYWFKDDERAAFLKRRQQAAH